MMNLMASSPQREGQTGAPLSLYIFILWMKAKNHAFLKEANSPKSGLGVKICPTAIKISCLLLADGCLCFAELILKVVANSKASSIFSIQCQDQHSIIINLYWPSHVTPQILKSNWWLQCLLFHIESPWANNSNVLFSKVVLLIQLFKKLLTKQLQD